MIRNFLPQLPELLTPRHLEYVYLLVCEAYALIWAALYLWKKEFRKKLLYSGLAALPLVLSSPTFIPDYWIPRFRGLLVFEEVYVEDFLFSFFVGSVCATLYQICFGKDVFRLRRMTPYVTLIPPLLYHLAYYFRPADLPFNIMHYAGASLLTGTAAVMLISGRTTALHLLLSGLMTTALYAVIYGTLWHTFPTLSASYQIHRLSGVLLAGIPVEEYVWIFSFSMYWTPVYELWRDYL